MAARCDICDKTPGFGHNVSHSNRKTNRRWNPNIQRHRLVINGVKKPYHICTKCMKTQLKVALKA